MNNGILIGFQREFKDIALARQFALYAKEYEYDWFRFNCKNIDFERHCIYGHVLDHGYWIKKTFPFPSVINNDAFLIRNQLGARLIKEYKIPLSYHRPIGGKIKLFYNLQQILPIKKYVLDFEKLLNIEQLIEYINKHKKCIIKPNYGSFGDFVYKIVYKNKKYIINSKFEYDSLYDFIEKKKLNIKHFLVQEYIKSSINKNIPIDIRCHLARSYNREWKLVSNTVRANPFDQIHSNLKRGGSKFPLKRFLDCTCSKKVQKNIYNQLFEIIKILPNQLNKFYPHDLNMLGIDIGIDFSNDGKLCIFEINSFPGTTFVEHKVARYAIQYDYWLGLQNLLNQKMLNK